MRREAGATIAARRQGPRTPAPPHFPPCFPCGSFLPSPRAMSTSGLDAVIWGITTAGRVFRPSDWAERLAGLTSAFGHDQKLAYSPLVRPVTVGGVKAVIVGQELEALEPRLHQFLLGFARDNGLQVTRAAGALAAPQRLVPPAAKAVAAPTRAPEPREPI
jgi:hypothetical protein